jgi:hypothetical protein
MTYTLTKQDAGRVLKFDTSKVITVPADVFSSGEVIVLFNNSNDFITIHSQVPTTYVAARNKSRTHIEFPPRGLANVLFIDDKTAVASGDVA